MTALPTALDCHSLSSARKPRGKNKLRAPCFTLRHDSRQASTCHADNGSPSLTHGAICAWQIDEASWSRPGHLALFASLSSKGAKEPRRNRMHHGCLWIVDAMHGSGHGCYRAMAHGPTKRILVRQGSAPTSRLGQASRSQEGHHQGHPGPPHRSLACGLRASSASCQLAIASLQPAAPRGAPRVFAAADAAASSVRVCSHSAMALLPDSSTYYQVENYDVGCNVLLRRATT